MQSLDEIAEGIAFLQRCAAAAGVSLSCRRMADRRVYYFEADFQGKQTDFALSAEFLMDLPAMSGHQRHVEEYLPAILTRLQNTSPNAYFSRNGVPLEVKLHWPFKEHPSRAVLWCHADVEDARSPGLIARTAPVIDLYLDSDRFEFRPFARMESVVNAIRRSLDKSEIHFFKRNEHPSETQEIRIFDRLEFPRVAEDALEQFIAGKVFWLGFKQGDQSTKVWIADPWDASYLGVSAKELIRTAQVLQAHGTLVLASDGQFASAGDILLQRPPVPAEPRQRIGFQASSQ